MLAQQGVEDNPGIEFRLGVRRRRGYRICIVCFSFTLRVLSQNRPRTDSCDWSIM